MIVSTTTKFPLEAERLKTLDCYDSGDEEGAVQYYIAVLEANPGTEDIQLKKPFIMQTLRNAAKVGRPTFERALLEALR